MSLIERHLEQITLSSESIATLPFPPPRIFTNALLSTSDITSLIRDTEPHERALFSVAPPVPPHTASTPHPDPKPAQRRQTVFNVAAGEVMAAPGAGVRAPRRNTAVAAVLGMELNAEVRSAEGKEADVEVLLRGAEKLNEVYEIQGVAEKIRNLRGRHEQLKTSLLHWEGKVERLNGEVERLKVGERDGWEDDDHGNGALRDDPEVEDELVTDDDLRREEEEIKELETRKRELEERVSGMERDLGGLLR